MKKKNNCDKCSCRLNKVGGQAVLEGVMMKAGPRTVTTCRKEDGTLTVNDAEFVSIRKKHKWLNLPILRGVVNFIEMLVLSMKTLTVSAEALGIDEETEEGKFAKWMKKHLGLSVTDMIMVISLILGLGLAMLLFMYLPILTADLFNWIFGGRLGAWRAFVEGGAKVVIFVAYLWLVSLMPDIKRTFMYHGAEHKTIACFESGEELTPENAMKHTRFHPRCGTSFMFFMILLGIAAGFFIRFFFPNLPNWSYYVIRPLLLPVLMGVGYEFIMFAGKHENFLTRALSAPGLWVQRITTKEPTADMLEVAIVSAKCALRDEFPEFRDFFDGKEWEPKEDCPTSTDENTENESPIPHSDVENESISGRDTHLDAFVDANRDGVPHPDDQNSPDTVSAPHFTDKDGSETADIKPDTEENV